MADSSTTFWDRLSDEDQSALKSEAEHRVIDRGDVLLRQGDVVDTVTMPIQGNISCLTYAGEGVATLSGNVGRSGLVGITEFMADQPAANEYRVQVGGQALAINGAAFRSQFERSESLRQAVLAEVYRQQVEWARNAVCPSQHMLTDRLARWLTELHDRTGLIDFAMTQDEMANRMGARRTSITEAWKALQAAKAVQCKRGLIRILDVPQLRAYACACLTD